jgi:hypothetical protein
MIKRTTRRCEHHLMDPIDSLMVGMFDVEWKYRGGVSGTVEGRKGGKRTWVLINRGHRPMQSSTTTQLYSLTHPWFHLAPAHTYLGKGRDKEDKEEKEGRREGGGGETEGTRKRTYVSSSTPNHQSKRVQQRG